MKCIYCCAEKRTEEFTKREHVIPQAFGKFKNNLTLIKKVCDDCNQYFGDTLEIALARDTPEGIMRFVHGIKEPNEYKTIGKKTRLNSIISKEGIIRDAFMKFTIKNESFGIEPKEQIGFLRKDKNVYDFYLLSDFPSSIDKNAYNLKDKKGIFYLCDFEKAKSVLKKLGIPLRENVTERPLFNNIETLNTNLIYTFDNIILRAICKISFNYFAKWNTTDDILDNNFNNIREFIRNGTFPPTDFFNHNNRPILKSDSPESNQRLCHIITIEPDINNEFIISRISLFNHSAFTILLGRLNQAPKNIIMKRGHVFNIKKLEVCELSFVD